MDFNAGELTYIEKALQDKIKNLTDFYNNNINALDIDEGSFILYTVKRHKDVLNKVKIVLDKTINM